MKLKNLLLTLSTLFATLFVGCDTENTTPPEPEKPKLEFVFEVSGITTSGATITVEPSSADSTYYWAVVEKSAYDKLASDEAYIQDEIRWLTELAENSNMTLKAYMADKLMKGRSTFTFDSFSYNTEYYAFAFGMTKDIEVTSDLSKNAFTTTEGLTFSFASGEITQSTIAYTATPSRAQESYYTALIEKSAYEAMTDSEELINSAVNYLWDLSINQNIDIDVVLGAMLYSSEQVITSEELKHSTEYIPYAFAMNLKGEVTSDITIGEPITTSEWQPQDPTTFEVTATNPEPSSFTVNVTPSNEATKYYVGIVRTAEVETTYNNDITAVAQALLDLNNSLDTDWESPYAPLYSGTQSLSAGNDLYYTLEQETPYTTVVFGVSTTGELTTRVASSSITTTKVEASDNKFTVKITAVRDVEADFTITTTNNDSYYWAAISQAEAATMTDQEIMDKYIADASYYLSWFLVTGDLTETLTDINPSTEYYMIVFGCDPAGVSTTALTKVPFTTAASTGAPRMSQARTPQGVSPKRLPTLIR